MPMRRMTLYRIAVSRAISRVLLGRPELLCALAEAYRHPGRHVLNALFLDRRHCERSLDWEARRGRPPDALDDWRGAGWL